jgi:YVTN family beta-propeller protein
MNAGTTRKSSFRRIAKPIALALVLLISRHGARGATPGSDGTLIRRLRQPVALVVVDGGKTVLAANQRSGSLSVVDATKRRVVAEHDLGKSLADLAVLPDGHGLLAIDQAANELMIIAYRDRLIRVIGRTKVDPDPVRLLVSADGSSCVVASRWSRQLGFVDVAPPASSHEHPTVTVAQSLALPICPGELAPFADGSRLVVADAFGGRIAVVNTKRRAIESIRTLPAHNIRGLAFAPDGRTLVIAHQVLNRLAQTSFDDVHWGLLIRNHLRVVRADALLQPGDDAVLLSGSRLFDLGDVGYAAGDPAKTVFDPGGNLIVALAGVDEVAITASPDEIPRRIVVGRRPTAVTPSPDGSVVYVADSLDDTISIVAIATGQRLATIHLGLRPELTAAERGERLFSSAKLSHDGWMSCHSCHTDGHTSGLLSDTLGDGSFGAPKRIPSLLGVAATGPWTWTGSINRLEDQIRKSITTTMHGSKPTVTQVADLTAYLGSLAAPSQRPGNPVVGDTTTVARGREVFRARQCATCHVPPEYTSPERYDVGLADEVGNHAFNPPSLRGAGHLDAFLHDGRVRTLEDVFRTQRHPRGLAMTPREITDLAAFLRTL